MHKRSRTPAQLDANCVEQSAPGRNISGKEPIAGDLPKVRNSCMQRSTEDPTTPYGAVPRLLFFRLHVT